MLRAALVAIAVLVLGAPWLWAPRPGSGAPTVWINEVDSNLEGTDDAEFVELAGPPGFALTGFRLVVFAADDPTPRVVRLDGLRIGANGLVVVGSPRVAHAARFVWTTNGLGNGSGAPVAVALYRGDAEPRAPTPTLLVDVVVWGARDRPSFREAFRPASPPPLTSPDSPDTSLSRLAGSHGPGPFSATLPPTPGAPNQPVRFVAYAPSRGIDVWSNTPSSLNGLSIAVFHDGHRASSTALQGVVTGLATIPIPPTPSGLSAIALVRGAPPEHPTPDNLLDLLVVGSGDGAWLSRFGVPIRATALTAGGTAVRQSPGEAFTIGPTESEGARNDSVARPTRIGQARGPVVGPASVPHASPLLGRTIVVHGVALLTDDSAVGQRALLYDPDDDPWTPDGVWARLPRGQRVSVGDTLAVTGTLVWQDDRVTLVATHVEIMTIREPPPPLALAATSWPSGLADWMRLDGSPVRLAAGLLALGPRTRASDGSTRLVVTPRATLPDRSLPDPLRVTLVADTATASRIPPARAGDRIDGPVEGVVRVIGDAVTIVVTRPSDPLTPGATPDRFPPPTPDPHTMFTVATLNLGNFFDRLDDPTNPHDNVGDPVVPPSDMAYAARLTKTARLIIDHLHRPDIVVVQEAEAQDHCRSSGLAPRQCDGPDGVPDSLADLIAEIAARSGTRYRAHADFSGADGRGILNAVLTREDRVAPVARNGPNPRAVNIPAPPEALADRQGERLHQRALLIGDYVIRVGATETVVTVIAAHFKSDPFAYRTRRALQAEHVASIARAIAETDPSALIVVAGDLNAPVDAPELLSLHRALIPLTRFAPAAYTYVFDGVATAIDGLWVSPSLAARALRTRVAHVNADWPDIHRFDARTAHRASDHDPVIAAFRATAPPALGPVVVDRQTVLAPVVVATARWP